MVDFYTCWTLDLQSRGRGFNSRSSRYQVVTTWMGDCLWTGKPSRYITNHQGQLSLPSLRGRILSYSFLCFITHYLYC